MSAILVAVNGGYYNSKFKVEDKKEFYFRSKWELTDDYPTGSNSYQLIMDGKKYLVGDEGTIYNIELNKTSNEYQKLLTYTALGLIARSNETNHFNVVALLPLAIYNNNTKQQFTEYLITANPIDITVNKKASKVQINRLLVFPECVSSIYNNLEFKDTLVGIVDIGGLTSQGIIFDKLKLIRETKFSNNLGSLVLYAKIKGILNNRYNANFQDYEIPYVLNDVKYQKDIEEVVLNHINELKRSMQSHNWNVDSLKLFFTGGGSFELQNFIKRVFSTAIISPNPLYDNVLGAYEVGKIHFK